MKRLIGIIVSLWMLTGCSTMNVFTDYWPETDFSTFQTFQYKDSSSTFAGSSPLAHQRIVNGIRNELVSAGFREVATDPDLYVTYYGDKSETMELQTTGWDYHYPMDWHRRHSTIGSQRYAARPRHTSTRVVTILEGTILIDMWDAGSKELVWRAEISDTISDNPDRNTTNINRGLSRAFANFPPPSGK